MATIEQTMDLIKFADILISEIEKAMADGSITVEEFKKILVANSSSAFHAVWNSWRVDDELLNLSEKDAQALSKEAMKLLLKLTKAIF